MSTTAVGITLDLDGPLPVARRYSLRSTPGVVVEEVGANEGEPRWMNGVNVIGYPDGMPETWEPCTTGTMRVKEDGSDQPQARFDPVAIYFPLTCSSLGMGDPDRFASRAEAVLEATLATGLESALVKGVPFSTNPFVADSNMLALTGNTAVSPRVGLSYLEEAIAGLTGRQGIIHATPGTITAWGFGDELNPSSADVDESPPAIGLRTSNGTPVISGAGYVDADPTSLAGPGATESWAFATGPVEVRIGDGPTMDITESMDRLINLVTFRAERYALIDWDTALQVGILIDWSLTP